MPLDELELFHNTNPTRTDALTCSRVDGSVTGKACGKKLDIPSQRSMVFLRQVAA